MLRSEVFNRINNERAYQDSMSLGPNGRTDGQVKQVGAFLALMQHALNEAHRAYYEKQGDEPALDMIRKVAGLTVQCMEIHGCPDRSIS